MNLCQRISVEGCSHVLPLLMHECGLSVLLNISVHLDEGIGILQKQRAPNAGAVDGCSMIGHKRKLINFDLRLK
jgi:hypothetical protein